MKRNLFIVAASAVAILAPSLRTHFTTANAVADDILAKLGISADASPDVIKAARVRLIDAANPAAISPLKDELGLGPLQLPAGVDMKDVLWRRRAGLDTKQAVQAALMQKRHDDAVGKKKAEKAKSAQVPGAALVNLGELTVEKLKEHAATLKGFELKATRKEDIIAAITAYNEKLAAEEKANS